MTLKTTTSTPAAATPITGGQLLVLKGDLGIDQINNTADASKPVSTAQAAAIAAAQSAAAADATAKANTAQTAAIAAAAADATSKANTAQSTAIAAASADATSKANAAAAASVPLTQKGAANGVATLDASSTIPIGQIPAGVATSIASMTSAASAGTDAERRAFLLAAGAAEFRPPITVNTDFTLTSLYANRRTDCAKGSAQAVLWDAGHGMTSGDSGRLVQSGASPITITKAGGFATGDLSLSTGVASATTVNDGDVLDWEYRLVEGVEDLLITYRSAAGAAGGGATLMAAPNDQSVTLTGGEDVLTSFTLPANSLGANGWAEFEKYMDRTSGANPWTPRLRLGNATTGMVIGTPGAPTSRSSWRSAFKNLGATNSQITGSTGSADSTGTGTPNTGTHDTTTDLTVYLTVQGTAGEVVRCRYLRGTAYFKA